MNVIISIIIPIYNVKSYLVKCIESVICQTYKDIEIILVDDGSSDGCAAICDEYAKRDNRIKVIHKENGGLVSARKAGAEVATGDYLACVDGDDWIDVTYAEKFVEIIKEHNADIICCSYYVASDEGSRVVTFPMRSGCYSKADIEREIFPILIHGGRKSFPIMLWAKVFRRELYVRQQLAVDNGICVGEDASCVIPCVVNANSLYVSHQLLYFYRVNPSSITKGKKAFDWNAPQLRGEHFEKQIDVNRYDFKAQLKRYVVHALFNTAVSQFNRKEKYGVIKKDIKLNLNKPYYKEMVKGCKFKDAKMRLALWTLKHKAVLILKIYNGIKK